MSIQISTEMGHSVADGFDSDPIITNEPAIFKVIDQDSNWSIITEELPWSIAALRVKVQYRKMMKAKYGCIYLLEVRRPKNSC